MKFKSIIVIIFSSILISSVILLTILGLTLFYGWKENESVKAHRENFAKLNAKIYNQLISIQQLRADFGKKGIYKDKYLLEGIVKNNGYRTLSSVKLGVEFLNNSGNVMHLENLLPLKAPLPSRTTTIAALSLFTSGKELALLPGGSQRFKHILNEQKNKNVISPIKYKKYATNPSEWSGKFNYRITAVRF